MNNPIIAQTFGVVNSENKPFVHTLTKDEIQQEFNNIKNTLKTGIYHQITYFHHLNGKETLKINKNDYFVIL